MAPMISTSSTRNCLLRRNVNTPAAPFRVSARKHKINNMSDTDQTGTQPEAQNAPVATPAPSAVPSTAEAKPAVVAATDTQPIGTFGTTRGSGLARGKRPASTPASTGPAKTEYTPTCIEVVKTETSFVNPFTPAEAPAPVVEKVEAAPAQPAPVAVAAPAPTPAAEVSAPQAPAPQAPVAEVAPSPAPAVESAPATAETSSSEEPAALNILPPAETKRPSQSWENRPPRREREGGEGREGRPRREDRGGYRGDRREETRPERREDAPQAEASEQVRPERQERQERPERRNPAPEVRTEEKPAKKGGFFAWLKGLFSGEEEKPATEQAREGGERRDGGGRRNRHRGGRGREGGFQGGERREGGFQGGERRDGQQGGGDGFRRRRRRGGRGRHQGGESRGGDSSAGPTQG